MYIVGAYNLTGWLAFAPSAIVNLLKQKTFLI